MASALDPLGVQLLLALLAEPRTEAELLALLPNESQATVNRRLDRLAQAGILAHEPGRRRAPGRAWSVHHPGETETVLDALFDLVEAIDARERKERAETRRELKRARAGRVGNEEAGDENTN